MTIGDMCRDIAAEIDRRGGPKLDPIKDIYEYSPTGELSAVFFAYYGLFPERLPTVVENPVVGDMRYDPALKVAQVWDGTAWR